MFIGEEYIIIVDYNNKSAYKVENKDLAKAYIDLALNDDANFGMSGLLIMLVFLIAIQMLVDKLMRKNLIYQRNMSIVDIDMLFGLLKC